MTASEDRLSPRPVVVLVQRGVTAQEARNARARAWQYIHACHEANRAARASERNKAPTAPLVGADDLHTPHRDERSGRGKYTR